MKQRVFILGFVFIFILGIFLIAPTYISFRDKTELLRTINISKIHNGDLILRCGRSTESFAVYLTDSNAEFTHIGIISLENGTPYVIHAVPHHKKFIKKDKLTQFLSSENTSKFALYRSKFSKEVLYEVVKEAKRFYTNKYTFDNEYDLNTNSKLYCSELILKAFRNNSIQLSLKPKELDFLIGKYPIIFPSEFTKHPFKKVNIN